MIHKKMNSARSDVYLFSFPIVLVAALLMLFSGVAYSSFNLSSDISSKNLLAEGNVLADDGEEEDEPEMEDDENDEDMEDEDSKNEDKHTDDSDENEDEDSDDDLDEQDENEDADEDESDDLDEMDDDEDASDMDEDSDIDETDDDIDKSIERFLETQKNLQEYTSEQIKKAEEREGVVKLLIGPDRETLKKLQEIVEKNNLLLAQLGQIKDDALTPEEQMALDSLKTSVENQNNAITDEIQSKEKAFSLFGWLVKLFD